MTPNTILWIYIALLVVGGFIGFFKAGSKASLVMSILFAIPLGFCAAGKIKIPFFADILLNGLLLFFMARYAKSKKIMPAGLMTLLSGATLVAHLLLSYKFK